VAYDPMATVLPPIDLPRETSVSSMTAMSGGDEPSNGSHKFTLRPRRSHGHGAGHGLKRLSQHFQQQLPVVPPVPVSKTTPCTPLCDGAQDVLGREAEAMRLSRRLDLVDDDNSRSRSVDRGLFSSTDKRAQPQVALSNAVAPGSVHRARHSRTMGSIDLGNNGAGFTQSLSSSPLSAAALDGHSLSDHRLYSRQHQSPQERPHSVLYPGQTLGAPPSPGRSRSASKPESPFRPLSMLANRSEHGITAGVERIQMANPADIPCPVSPEDNDWEGTASRQSSGDILITAQSSSTESMEGLGTPLTSPSEVTSPVSAYQIGKNASDRILTFQSDPSLPALLSGASSISADMEAELLGQPGLLGPQRSLLETTDSLTPPALMKEPANGFPIGQVFENPPAMVSGSLDMPLHPDRTFTPAGRAPEARPSRFESDDDDDDGSDDDGIFLMAKSKRKSAVPQSGPRAPPFAARRRDTEMSNMSTASTETAKRVVVEDK
jgi:hypothetical protein